MRPSPVDFTSVPPLRATHWRRRPKCVLSSRSLSSTLSDIDRAVESTMSVKSVEMFFTVATSHAVHSWRLARARETPIYHLTFGLLAPVGETERGARDAVSPSCKNTLRPNGRVNER